MSNGGEAGAPGELVLHGPLIIDLGDVNTGTTNLIKFRWTQTNPSFAGGGKSNKRRFEFNYDANTGFPSSQVQISGVCIDDVTNIEDGATPVYLRHFLGSTMEGPFTPSQPAFLGFSIQTLTDGPTVTPNLDGAVIWELAANGSRTIAAPTTVVGGPRFILLRIKNITAGAITTTFNAVYHLSWTDPGAGQSHTQLMYWDGAAMWQVGAGVTVT